jgi:hypothetical protein
LDFTLFNTSPPTPPHKGGEGAKPVLSSDSKGSASGFLKNFKVLKTLKILKTLKNYPCQFRKTTISPSLLLPGRGSGER